MLSPRKHATLTSQKSRGVASPKRLQVSVHTLHHLRNMTPSQFARGSLMLLLSFTLQAARLLAFLSRLGLSQPPTLSKRTSTSSTSSRSLHRDRHGRTGQSRSYCLGLAFEAGQVGVSCSRERTAMKNSRSSAAKRLGCCPWAKESGRMASAAPLPTREWLSRPQTFLFLCLQLLERQDTELLG